VGRLWKLAKRLEGTIRNCGTHAAGVVICDKSLTDYVALYQAAGTDTVTTQLEMKALEEVGLLKMDFLGLRTLTVIHETVRLVRESRGVTLDIDAIEPDDSATYALLRSGQTTGVFQLESPGMRDLARRIGLESLEEICALVALYRPGPMQFIEQYIQHKHKPDTIRFDHPLLEPILRETYGIAVYQEQVMQIVQALAGFSLGQADILRRAMGKKNAKLMAQQKTKFVEGCLKNGLDEALAQTLYGKIETFAGYGFNKSHSMAYAFVAYQTAYLKAHFPAEFMAALLTSESGNLDKIAIYVEECRRLNINVLPPDVNHSHLHFHAEGDTIRFGLLAIKNVGEAPANGVVQERLENGPYKDIYDFCERLDAHWINRRLVESLNNAGAFEESNWSRAEIDVSIERAMEEAQIVQRERASGQGSLLDLLGPDDPSASLHERPHIQAWTDAETLAREKLVLGLYVSSHPLEQYRSLLNRFTTPGLDTLDQFRERQDVIVGGILSEIKLHTTVKGKRMAFVTLETLEGSRELTIFSDTFEEHRALIVQDTVLIIPAVVNYRNGQAGLIASDIIPIEKAEKRLAKALHLRLNPETMKNGRIEELAHLLGARPGSCDVYLHYQTEADVQVTVHATSSCRVTITDELVLQVTDALGSDGVWLSAATGLPRH
ncbi:MAG: DNA polymerase III subunit alpha, partial [Candidatus Hydrogenedentes bacterium]|nr:DNA polymerase III subunit alpha [Candidatus Hydrogenedentota bacterium]